MKTLVELLSIVLMLALTSCLVDTEETRTGSSVTSLRPGEYTVESDGITLWYKVSGTGPVCLMPTPPWGPSSDLYFRTLQVMEKYFTIIYIDSRGTGRSGRAKTAKDYTWAHLVNDLEVLRTHLNQEAVWLMGHSAAGVLVLHYAAQHPRRVNGLILLDTGAVSDHNTRADIQKRIKLREKEPWYEDAIKALQTDPKTDEEFAQVLKAGLPLYWSNPQKAESFKDDFAAMSV
jgi:proline iminopeptidase